MLLPLLLVLSITPCLQDSAPAPPDDAANGRGKTQVMILGSVHFDNPMRDVHNVTIDDVMSEKRQAQVIEVVSRLATWKPTMIGLEVPADAWGDARRDPGSRKHSGYVEFYERYVAGTRELSRSESDQIGFRLAKKLGHERVHAIDGQFPYLEGQLARFAEERDLSPLMERGDEMSNAANGRLLEHLSTSTYSEFFRAINDPAFLLRVHRTYFPMIEVGGTAAFPETDAEFYFGADVVGGWYQRNVRIFSNIQRLSRDPNDRILIVIGLGHAHILRTLIQESPDHELVDVRRYLE